MALVQIRNPEMAHNRTVIAGEAMTNGMVVRLVQAATKGDPCKVMKAVAGDVTDTTAMLGIVTYIADSDLTVDFILTPATEALTLNTDTDNSTDIPSGAMCVFWYNKPVVGIHPSLLDSSIVIGTIREGAVIAMKESTSKLALYASGDTTRDVPLGIVYQHEDAELSILLFKL